MEKHGDATLNELDRHMLVFRRRRHGKSRVPGNLVLPLFVNDLMQLSFRIRKSPSRKCEVDDRFQPNGCQRIALLAPL
jgi:hypothetical protein